VVDVRSAVLDTVGDTRTMSFLVAGFALLALTLAVVGLYGLVSYGASRRAREFGIRIALGARPGSLSRLVFERVGLLTGLGVALGLVVSVSAGRALRGVLFGVGALDVPALLAALSILVLVALTAAWLPARRAGRVDPVVSLREGSH
jgi:ABC-type antimicrobial peptide transport system permease subunit